MKRRKAIRWKNALFLVMLLAVGFLMVGKTGIETEAAMTLTNPRIVEDASMEAGQKVTWDCIWFGSYPQAEVVTSAMHESYIAVDESLLSDEDLVVSDRVYANLEIAEGWDSNNDIILDGVKYRRMRKEDGSCRYFRYDPIKWRVLSVDRGQALLFADRVLDVQQYNKIYEGVTWETSTIRSWLNGYGPSLNGQGEDYASLNFLISAFTVVEQSAIFSTSVVNEDNITFGTEGGQDTSDKLFFLSEKEVYGAEQAAVYGFVEDSKISDEARRKKSSIYAQAKGEFTGNCGWWLRSPGGPGAGKFAVKVSDDGSVSQISGGVHRSNGVCPALYLKLSSSDLYSYAGTVSSDGIMIKNIALCEASIDDAIYTGYPQTPQVTVDDGDTVLKKGIDYTVTFSQNIEAGIARAKIVGIGSYMGNFVKEFSIRKAEQMPEVSIFPGSIYVGEYALITANGKGALSFISDNAAVATVDTRGRVMGVSLGIVKITVTAAGDMNYNSGSAVLNITVTEKVGDAPNHGGGNGTEGDFGNGGDIESEGNTGTPGAGGNTGNVGKSETGGNSGMASDTDFGQETGTSFGTTNQTISQKITALSKTVVYKSKPFSLKAKASGGGKLTYKSNNKKVAMVSAEGKVTAKGYGEAQITIKAAAKGNYKEATKKITVKVVPRAPKFANAKQMKIKQDKTISGYEVYFSTKKSFNKNIQKGRFERKAHGMRVVGLKRNVSYYVKIRAYKNVGKKTYYSAWSKVIRVKR